MDIGIDRNVSHYNLHCSCTSLRLKNEPFAEAFTANDLLLPYPAR